MHAIPEAPKQFSVGLQRRVFNWALKQARLRKGLTMQGLADAVGCSLGSVYDIASFRHYPGSDLRIRISMVLEVPEDILFPPELEKVKLLKQPQPVEIPMSMLAAPELLALSEAEIPSEWLDDAVDAHLLKQSIKEVLTTLSPREAAVLRMRFGLDDGHARLLEDVGKRFGVTRERIRQIEAKALRKLRHPKCSRKLKDFLT